MADTAGTATAPSVVLPVSSVAAASEPMLVPVPEQHIPSQQGIEEVDAASSRSAAVASSAARWQEQQAGQGSVSTHGNTLTDSNGSNIKTGSSGNWEGAMASSLHSLQVGILPNFPDTCRCLPLSNVTVASITLPCLPPPHSLRIQ